jgi:arginyl-tRNA synthetase
VADPLALIAERAAAAMEALTSDAASPDAGPPDPVVRPSQHADAQVNGALGLAKRLGRPPREVATELATALGADPVMVELCEPPEVAGPGFINLAFRNDALAGLLDDVAGPHAGVTPAAVRERIVVDYSAPNVAKEMHVGHLRSTIIGDALARTLAFLGHDVIRQNHLGDWGTPFGMLIEHLVDSGVERGGDPAANVDIADLNAFYRAARVKFDDDPAFAERSRGRVVALQAGDPDSRQLWQVLVEVSTSYFSDAYRRLEISLTDDDYAGESTYNDVLDDVVAELVAKGIVTEDQGALCAFPAGFTGREGEPLPLIVRKADGGYGYAATDLAALRHRTLDLGARQLLYVVGAPQHDHLEMVFAVGREAGWVGPDVDCEHVSFGSVLGTDGKMFRTRAGDTVRLADLVDEAESRARALVETKSTDLDPDEVTAVSSAIGIGAVKYADLSSDRVKDYVFDWDRMLALTGNTAPYLQYAHARICSILAKADTDDRAAATPAAVHLTEPAEHDLAVALLGLDAAVHATADRRAPHRLCTYLFDLASAYTTFYEACPVLRADDERQRRSRLALCALTANVLARGLDLLGIRAPERV